MWCAAERNIVPGKLDLAEVNVLVCSCYKLQHNTPFTVLREREREKPPVQISAAVSMAPMSLPESVSSQAAALSLACLENDKTQPDGRQCPQGGEIPPLTHTHSFMHTHTSEDGHGTGHNLRESTAGSVAREH